jgi:hypothetical protein
MSYLAKFGKNYATTVEFNKRMENYEKTDKLIKSYRAKTTVLAHNKFSDWS